MSYSVNIPIAESGPDPSLSVTTFAGGPHRGRMIQLTIGGEFVQLTAGQQDHLIEVLSYARYNSLENYPPRGDGAN